MKFLGQPERPETQGNAVEKPSAMAGSMKKAVAREQVTLLACVLGAVASLGGFIFGYVRCVCC